LNILAYILRFYFTVRGNFKHKDLDIESIKIKIKQNQNIIQQHTN
jgi:hypothetical protein